MLLRYGPLCGIALCFFYVCIFLPEMKQSSLVQNMTFLCMFTEGNIIHAYVLQCIWF